MILLCFTIGVIRISLGTYTPNYNLYMPSIGEQGWGELVSNNFEILDTISNTFNTQISNINENLTTLNLATASGTRILMIPIPNQTITTSNFSNYASYDSNNVYIASFGGNTTFSSIPQPPHSCRLMIILVYGNATFNGNINTYPTTLQYETPPNSTGLNTYTNDISFIEYYAYKIILEYIADENNSILNMNQEDYLNFINNTMLYTPIFTTIQYSLSIPLYLFRMRLPLVARRRQMVQPERQQILVMVVEVAEVIMPHRIIIVQVVPDVFLANMQAEVVVVMVTGMEVVQVINIDVD